MIWLFTQQDFSIVGRTFGFAHKYEATLCLFDLNAAQSWSLNIKAAYET